MDNELRYLAAVVARGTELPANGVYTGRQTGCVCKFEAKDQAGTQRGYHLETKTALRGLNCRVRVTVADGVATSSSDT